MDKQLLDALRKLGLKDYEARVFIALLHGNPMSASKIARSSNLIRNSIYDTLKTFVEKGYCNEIETNTVLQYTLIDPVIIFDKIEKEYHDSLKSKLLILKDVSEKVAQLYKKNSATDVDADNINIELMRGFNKHRLAKYTELFKQARQEVLGMFSLRGVVTGEIDDIAKDFVKKGGILKSIYKLSLDFKIIKNGRQAQPKENDLINLCESFQKTGEELRLTSENIPNITIFDKKIVFTNLTDSTIPKHKRADIIVKNSSYAEQITELFRTHWNKAITLEEYKKKLLM
jgi:sugar-specific transcriptional regulator TrmB